MKVIFSSDNSEHERISSHLLLSSLSILSTLDIYYPSFAQALVQSTKEYYSKEAETLSITMQPAEYIAHVDTRLRQEDRLCDHYFERQSKKEVMQVVQNELISQVSQNLIDKGFDGLVKSNDVDSLRILYRLLSLVKELEIMRSAWSDYIRVFPTYFVLT